jgi:outer membrane biosynthesis protein TonB
MQELTMTLVAKEKKPEAEKKPEPKFEPPKKVETPRAPEQPQVAAVTPTPAPVTAPVEVAVAAAAAPPPAELPSFSFGEGVIQTDPVSAYKSHVERTLRAHWRRPEDMNDAAFMAEVEMSVDANGYIQKWDWQSGSGEKRWDDSVRAVFASHKSVNKVPPPNFPEVFRVRFDVVADQEVSLTEVGVPPTANLTQASPR